MTTRSNSDLAVAPGARRHQGFARPLAPSVVVGLGNEIVGDDGIGLHVAEVLQVRLRDTTDIDVVSLPWAGLSLLDVLRGRKRAAIVDCLTSGTRPPGTVVRLDQEGLAGSVRLNSFHDLGLPTAIALGRRLGWDLPDTIGIWGVEAERAGTFHEGLSPVVVAAVEPLICELLGFLGATPESLEVVA
jgi:hydrogenase maturation protease